MSRTHFDSVLKFAFLVVLALPFLVAVLPLLLPNSLVAASAHFAFTGLCHQDPTRSLQMNGDTMAACLRCSGIYLGFIFGGVWQSLARRSPRPENVKLWILCIAPMVIHVGLASLWPLFESGVVRVATGLLFGLRAGAVLSWAATIIAALLGRRESHLE